MYKILTVKDKIRVPPIKFRYALDEAVKSSLDDRWAGTIDKQMGVLLSVISVEEVGEGKILPGDGSIHYPVTFTLLTYLPELHEVITGSVIDVTEFGVFVRMGPLDGMIHVSQIMDDFVSYDAKNSIFSGRDSQRVLRNGDIVRARIISISLGRDYKIGITTRQPGLGSLAWVDQEKKGVKAPARRERRPRRDA
ncbi:MAG: DNA-directed RNA polymerase [Candidatus Aenigmarchaeota archaeon]|nr:DNA-directed RNA polymerase [Candidatus Aenigmarchaeota archaeon]